MKNKVFYSPKRHFFPPAPPPLFSRNHGLLDAYSRCHKAPKETPPLTDWQRTINQKNVAQPSAPFPYIFSLRQWRIDQEITLPYRTYQRQIKFWVGGTPFKSGGGGMTTVLSVLALFACCLLNGHVPFLFFSIFRLWPALPHLSSSQWQLYFIDQIDARTVLGFISLNDPSRMSVTKDWLHAYIAILMNYFSGVCRLSNLNSFLPISAPPQSDQPCTQIVVVAIVPRPQNNPSEKIATAARALHAWAHWTKASKNAVWARVNNMFRISSWMLSRYAIANRVQFALPVLKSRISYASS